MSDPIRVEHLGRRYGQLAALSDVSFSVQACEIIGLLGRNGAGKTTTVEILEGFRSPSAGTVGALGRDPPRADRRLKNLVGVVPQSGAVDSALSIGEVVRLYASFYRPRRSTRVVLADVGLEAEAQSRVAVLSGRLDLALALVGFPQCSSSTSPQLDSTPLLVTKSGESSPGFVIKGSRSCSPRTTWRRSRPWPTGSSSCTADV